jgi:hypothetical protein
MQILDYPTIWEWCRGNGAALTDSNTGPVVVPDPAFSHRSRLDWHTSKSTTTPSTVVSSILTRLGPWDECLIWITGWGVWPSSEDWPRYYALRARFSDRRSLDEAPGHLALPADEIDLQDLLAQVLDFGWDASVVPAASGRITDVHVEVSHDGWVAFHSREPFPTTSG